MYLAGLFKDCETGFKTGQAFQIRGERFSSKRLESALEMILFLHIKRELFLLLLPPWAIRNVALN